MATSELSELDELAEIEKRTNSDGTVDVTIESWSRVSDRYCNPMVEVEFSVIDNTETELMEWPTPGEDLQDNKFYQLIRQEGYELHNADLIEGTSVKASHEDSWSIVIEQSDPIQTRVMESVTSIPWVDLFFSTSFVFMILTIIYALVMLV